MVRFFPEYIRSPRVQSPKNPWCRYFGVCVVLTLSFGLSLDHFELLKVIVAEGRSSGELGERGTILSGNVDKKLPSLCVQERGEGKPKNFPLGKGEAQLDSIQIAGCALFALGLPSLSNF